MTITPKEFQKLQDKVDQLKQEHDRAEGALSQLMVQLKEQHGVTTLSDAKALLKKLEKLTIVAEKKFDKALDEFNEQWSEKLKQIT